MKVYWKENLRMSFAFFFHCRVLRRNFILSISTTSGRVTRPLRLCQVFRNDPRFWYSFLLVWRTRRKIRVHLSLLQSGFAIFRWNVCYCHQNM